MLPVDAIVLGEALNDVGFVGNDAVEGLGLVTAGFLWPCAGIWAPMQAAITTTWINIQTSVVTVETCSD